MRLLIHLKLQLERKLLYMCTADRVVFYIPAYNRDVSRGPGQSNALQGSNFSWGFDIYWFSFGQLCLNPIWKRKVCCVVNAGLPNKGALRNCCPRLSPEWQPCRLAAIPSVRRALDFSKILILHLIPFNLLFESDPEYYEWKRCLIIKAMIIWPKDQSNELW